MTRGPDRAVRAAVLEAPGRLVERELPRPALSADDGLLRVELAGVCGTDLKLLHGAVPYPYPLVLGHEILGSIEELGDGMAERTGLARGDRVVVEGWVPCWSCAECHRGAYRFCPRRRGYGTTTTSDTPPFLWGAFAELMYLAPGSLIHRIDAAVPARAAVLAPAVLANGFEWTRERGGLRAGETIVVLGAGPQGLAQVVVARECGAALIVITGLHRDAQRLELARRLGADVAIDVEADDPAAIVRDLTAGRMADLVVDVSGSPAATASAPALLRQQGRIVLAGLAGSGVRTDLELDALVWNELSVLGVYTQTAASVRAAIRLTAARRYPLEEIVSHVFPLRAAGEAVRSLEAEGAGYPIKSAVAPGGDA